MSDIDLESHEKLVASVVRKAFRREGRTCEQVEETTPLTAMLERERDAEGDEISIKMEAVDTWLGWIFEDGPHPSRVMKRLYAMTRSYRPELLLNMPGGDIAAILGQTRAAESARIKMLIGGTLKKAGFKRTTLRFQKSESAVAKFRECARGNHHRANSVKKKKAANAA